jgi:hypothetical protein
MAVTIDGAGPLAGATTLNGLTIPTTSFGKVLQVVYGSTGTTVTSSSTTLVDTGLTATITPSSTTSKILVIMSQNGMQKSNGNGNNGCILRLYRDDVNIATPSVLAGWTNSTVYNTTASISCTSLDSPSSTSALVYKTMFSNYVAAASIVLQTLNAKSTITLMEISA